MNRPQLYAGIMIDTSSFIKDWQTKIDEENAAVAAIESAKNDFPRRTAEPLLTSVYTLVYLVSRKAKSQGKTFQALIG